MNTFKNGVLILLLILPSMARAQRALEPYFGYGIDARNKEKLSTITIGVQYPIIDKPVYQMLIGMGGGFPLNKSAGNDIAYTSDPLFPLNTNVGYETKLYSLAFYLGHRFKVFSWQEKNTISLFANIGVGRLSIGAHHEGYDMNKYTILNPHRSATEENLMMAGGMQYRRSLNLGYLFVQADVMAPPFSRGVNNYHYRGAVLLSLNLGYGIQFKKNK